MLKIVFFISLLLSISAYAQSDLATLEYIQNDLSSIEGNQYIPGLRKSESGVLDRGDLIHNLSVILNKMVQDTNVKPNIFYKININDINDIFTSESFRLKQLHYYVELLFQANDIERPNKLATSWEALKENVHFLRENGQQDIKAKVVGSGRLEGQKLKHEIKASPTWRGCEEF